MRKTIKWLSAVIMLLCVDGVNAQKYENRWESLDSRPIPSWFEDAKFGIFIHWGLYSVPSYSPTARDGVGVYERYSEHYWRRINEESGTKRNFVEFHENNYGPEFTYQDFAPLFKAELFDPELWAEIIKDAGARYVVLTSKHHDGYALWPSRFAWNWNAVDTGPHRDLLGDLTAAVKESGMKMGFYYSLLEWYNPLYTPSTIDDYVERHMLPQMKELVTKYNPEIFWPDGEWDFDSDALKSVDFLQWLYNESPVKETVVVNDRWGRETRGKHGGYYTTEYDLIHNDSSKNVEFTHPWEECRGIGGSFGFNRGEILADYETSGSLIHMLIEKVSRGGNLLLNIGPTADGRIPVIMQQRLSDIGRWLKVNGDAIYGSRKWSGSAAAKSDGVFFTRKGSDLYVILTRWPSSTVEVRGVKKPASVSLLGSGAKVYHRHRADRISIDMPALTPGNAPCDHAWVIKLENCL
jgi:alpha-L-fucosidase